MRRSLSSTYRATRKSLSLLSGVGILIASSAFAAPPDDGSGRRGPRGPRGPEGSPPPGGAMQGGAMQGGAMRGGAMQGGMMQGRMMQAMPLVKALDADGDGTISAQEIANASAQLKTLDTDGDGTLSRQELMPARGTMAGGALAGGRRGNRGDDAMRNRKGGQGQQQGQAGPQSAEMMGKVFDRRDADGDGKLTGDEIPQRMQQRLDRVDTDQDGAISREELESVAEKMRRGGDKAGRGGKGRGGDDLGAPGGQRPRRPSDT